MAKKFLDESGVSTLWNKIKSMFVKKSGATDVNKMSFKSGQYYGDDGNYAMDLNNSDIIGVNMLLFEDPLNSGEGIAFPRDNGNYDLLRVYNGELLLNTDLSDIKDDIVASNTPYKVVCENKEIHGHLSFASTADNSSSYGLTWYGSTDSAVIYYQVAGADEGSLVIESKDDSNAKIIIRNNNQGSIKDTIFENGEIYTAGSITLATGACISGETSDTKVYHSIELGYPNKDYLDFNEYGGVFNFNKTNNQTKEKIAYIDGNGVYHSNKKLATEEYVNNKMPTFSFSNGVLTITTH